MKKIITISFVIFFGIPFAQTQTLNDSIYNSWWANKKSSIFNKIDSGQFNGTGTGYFQIVHSNHDTLMLDFKTTQAKLDIEKDPDQVYDNSTKYYTTTTTSGKTTLKYATYALANTLTIILNNQRYKIGIIDGASDMPIFGLTFNYCSKKGTEYLTLFVTQPLKLTITQQIMETQNMNYPDAKKKAKSLIVLPGSTFILTIDQ